MWMNDRLEHAITQSALGLQQLQNTRSESSVARTVEHIRIDLNLLEIVAWCDPLFNIGHG